MKVVVVVDVEEHERYTVAKYFAVAGTTKTDRERTRATRVQVRRFAAAALRSSIKNVMRDLPPRQHAHARLLSEGRPTRELLPEPREQQRALQW